MCRQSGKVKCTRFGLWLWPDASTFLLHSLLVSTLRYKSPCCFWPLWHMQESHRTRHLYIGMHKLCSLAPRIIVRVSLLSLRTRRQALKDVYNRQNVYGSVQFREFQNKLIAWWCILSFWSLEEVCSRDTYLFIVFTSRPVSGTNFS